MHVCACVSISVCVCMCVHVCMCVCMCVVCPCVYVCAYVCMCMCVHVCVCTIPECNASSLCWLQYQSFPSLRHTHKGYIQCLEPDTPIHTHTHTHTNRNKYKWLAPHSPLPRMYICTWFSHVQYNRAHVLLQKLYTCPSYFRTLFCPQVGNLQCQSVGSTKLIPTQIYIYILGFGLS